MADTNESFRENVHGKSANELFGRNRHQPLFITVGVISPAEGDVIACNQPMNGDRGRGACSLQDSERPGAGRPNAGFALDDPILPEHGSQESGKDLVRCRIEPANFKNARFD